MSKLTASLLFVVLFAAKAQSQTISLSGKVQDTIQNKSVQNAVVMLLTPVDSLLYKFARTDAEGNYSFKNIKSGNYILMTTHPYFADFVDNISLNQNESNTASVALTSKSKLLQELIVKSGNPIRVKGDTTIYTADSFKVSANANVEELLKKLPGIQVDKNGKITAMGEQVTKVLVDGEEFFGDDPGMAVKNLRADAVKEVQVFDKKSEQAEFTGVDDGNTQKTINLKLKEDKKKGYFGKIDLAGGLKNKIDDRYNSNVMLSSFKGKRKISGYFLTGNTGQDGLSWEDRDKYTTNDNFNVSMDDNGDLSYQWTGGNSDDEPYVNTQNGFIRNMNAGLQYSNKWGDKQNLNFTPQYNGQIYDNDQSRFMQSQYNDSVLNEQKNTNTHVNRYNYKNTATYEVKIDSNNTIKFTAKANFYHTESEETVASFTKEGNTGTFKNRMNSDIKTENDKRSLFAGVLFKHRFKKPRRTISLNTDWNNLSTDGTSFLQSVNQSYDKGQPTTPQNVDQQRITDKSSTAITARLVYTEPLSKKYSLELGYELNYSKGKNNQLTYAYSPVSGLYDLAVDSLTNDFNQKIVINKPSMRISYSGKKIKFSFGSGFGFTKFDLHDNTLDTNYIRNYTNFFPSANFNYTYKSQHNLRIGYNGNTTQPTINQLQPLRNNNDNFNQYIGNPQLRPSFTNQFYVSHNTYNFLKDLFTYQSFNVRFISNSITNNRTIDLDSGKTVTKPINTNGNYSMSFWGGTGFKIKKIDTRLYLGPNFRYSKTADVFNSAINYSKIFSGGLDIGLSKSKEKKYDFDVNNTISYNHSKSSQSSSPSDFFTNMLSLSAKVYMLKTLSVRSDYEYYYQQKTQYQSKNISYQMWNARMEKTFKKDEFTAYVLVRDILNQNVGINSSYDRNTFVETRNDRLQRYWMVGVVWNFKNAGAKAKQ
ncbi:MAG: TonB-dependent receptor [Ferruginibacter sp.]|nr:TonB-dependent receptor [Ferruginibacter sp.]